MSVAAPADVLVVLAGGRSRRFGTDKALAPFDESGFEREPLALRTLRRLATVAPRRVLVRAAPLPGMPRDVVRVADPRPGGGPLQALAAAFAAVPARRWFVAPCDLPWLEPQDYDRLARALAEASLAAALAVPAPEGEGDRASGDAADLPDVAVARAPDGLEPLVAVWTPPAAAQLADWLAAEPELAVHAALARLATVEVEFDDPRPFLNVNTRDDLSLARSSGSRA